MEFTLPPLIQSVCPKSFPHFMVLRLLLTRFFVFPPFNFQFFFGMESPLDLIKYCHFSFKIFFLIIENPNEGLCAMNTDLVSIITLPPLVQGTLYTCVNTTFPEQYLTVPFELCVVPLPHVTATFLDKGGKVPTIITIMVSWPSCGEIA